MPISATGDRRDQRGFTLVDLMIVLAIIGLASGVAVMTMPDPRGRLTDAAERFAARAAIARDAAIVDGRETSLVIDAAGYGFEERRQGAWRPATQRALGRAEWDEGIGVAIGRDARATIIFDTTGMASEPIALTLRRDGERVGVTIGQDGSIRVE